MRHVSKINELAVRGHSTTRVPKAPSAAKSADKPSFFDKSQSHFNLRRTIVTDANGRYQFRSIVPMGYGCPPEGTTQRLLNLLARHGRRPAHIHFFVSAAGHRKLTTQINIDGDEYLWDDLAFASRDGLVPAVERVEISGFHGCHHFMAAAKPWLLGATRCVSFWDFLDAPREPILPPTASCVRWHEERRRAALQMEAPSWPPCGGMRVLVL